MMKIIYYRHNRFGAPLRYAGARTHSFGITLVTSGHLAYTVNGRACDVCGGDVIYLPAGCERAREVLTESDYYSFNFESDEAPDFPIHMKGAFSPALKNLLSYCDEIQKEMPGVADPRFAGVLFCVLEQLTAQNREISSGPLVRRIKRYLGEHLHEHITLADVGSAVFFSPNYCQSVFRRETGCTIIDYLIGERIREAQERIAAGNEPLPVIAKEIGFEDYNYFSRIFHRRTGYTPTQYQTIVR